MGNLKKLFWKIKLFKTLQPIEDLQKSMCPILDTESKMGRPVLPTEAKNLKITVKIQIMEIPRDIPELLLHKIYF